ncbi:MAG: acyl carrier protein [Candidatus Izemoplasmataceae bacterium]
MFDKVKKIIASELGVDEEKITLSANIIDDLDADSLDVVELIMALEDEFDVTIEDSLAQSMQTVEDIVKYIEGAV